MSDTNQYVVLKKHTLGHEIGAVIELTEIKAAGLVGKIRLKSEEADQDDLAVVVGKLKTENNELAAEIQNLENKIKNLTSKNTQLKKQLK